MLKFFKSEGKIPEPEGKGKKQETKEELYKRLTEISRKKEEPEMTPEQKKEMRKSVEEMYEGLLKEAEEKGDEEKIRLYKAALKELEKKKEE